MVRTYAFRQYVEVVLDSVQVPEGMHHFTAEAVQQLLAEFFERGCCTEQLAGFLPSMIQMVSALRRDNNYVQETGLLLDLYTSMYPYLDTEVRFTQPIEIGVRYPALSQCLAGESLKIILSVRECDEYGTFGARKCHKRNDDPLTLPVHLLHQPPKKAKVEESEESMEERRRRQAELALRYIDFQFP